MNHQQFWKDHPFSTYVKFFEKLIFLRYATHANLCVLQGKKFQFFGTFAYVLNGSSLEVKQKS